MAGDGDGDFDGAGDPDGDRDADAEGDGAGALDGTALALGGRVGVTVGVSPVGLLVPGALLPAVKV